MYYDRVYFATGTTGTGTITAGAAESGFRNLAGASIPDGDEVEYAITQGAAWEVGTGIVGDSASTLTRILSESSTGGLLDLTGSAKVLLTPIADRLNQLRASMLGALSYYAINDFADGETLYVGKAKSDGTWLVQRYATATDTLRYANVSNNAEHATYAAAWAARVSLTYATFQTLTGV